MRRVLRMRILQKVRLHKLSLSLFSTLPVDPPSPGRYQFISPEELPMWGHHPRYLRGRRIHLHIIPRTNPCNPYKVWFARHSQRLKYNTLVRPLLRQMCHHPRYRGARLRTCLVISTITKLHPGLIRALPHKCHHPLYRGARPRTCPVIFTIPKLHTSLIRAPPHTFHHPQYRGARPRTCLVIFTIPKLSPGLIRAPHHKCRSSCRTRYHSVTQ